MENITTKIHRTFNSKFENHGSIFISIGVLKGVLKHVSKSELNQ